MRNLFRIYLVSGKHHRQKYKPFRALQTGKLFRSHQIKPKFWLNRQHFWLKIHFKFKYIVEFFFIQTHRLPKKLTHIHVWLSLFLFSTMNLFLELTWTNANRRYKYSEKKFNKTNAESFLNFIYRRAIYLFLFFRVCTYLRAHHQAHHLL